MCKYLFLLILFLTDQAPITKEKDKEPKKKWTVQIAKQWKKMQPGSSNMPTPSYPEGGSIGKLNFGIYIYPVLYHLLWNFILPENTGPDPLK